MSVEFIFETVSRELPEAGVGFLMIGGHAVNHYGYTRATMDVDFMIAADSIGSVREVMKSAGFTNVSEGENVIFFHHPDSRVRVDFLPVDSETMTKLKKDAVEVDYGGFPLCVPSLLDLIAMKLFAMKNPKRKERDGSDIVHLMVENKLDSEMDLKPLCDKFATDAMYERLKHRIEEERNV